MAQPKQEERRVVSDCGTCEQKLNQNTITNEENAIEFTGNSPTAKPIGKIALNEATSRKEKKKQRRQKEMYKNEKRKKLLTEKKPIIIIIIIIIRVEKKRRKGYEDNHLIP